MRHRRGIFTTAALVSTVLALILAGVPGVAFGLQVLIGPLKPGAQIPQQANLADVYNAMDLTQASVSGQIVVNGSAVAADCAIPSGGTSCTVPSVSINASPVPSLFTIFPGGTANATKAPGSINKVTLNNVTIQVHQANVTIVAVFFHWFTGVNTSVLRSYGQAASGSLCRPDVNNNCQTAVGDSVRLNSAVIYAKNNGNLADPVGCLNTALCQVSFLPQSQATQPYTVAAGGIANNNYFPEGTLPTTVQTALCTLGGCQSAELIVSALTFAFTTANDAVIQQATHLNASGPNLGLVQNTIHAEAVEIDIAPGPYNPNNNDINLTANGQKTVSLLSQKQGSTVIFDPQTVDLTSVLFAVGDGGGAAPVSVSPPVDLNGDGVLDLIFTFSIPAIGPNAIPPGTCSTQGFSVGVGVLTGTADFTSSPTSTSTQQNVPQTGVPSPTCTTTTDPTIPNVTTTNCTSCQLNTGGNPNKMTCTTISTVTSHDSPFSGQQTFTCAPQASGN